MLTSPLANQSQSVFKVREEIKIPCKLTRQEQQLPPRRQPIRQIAHDIRIRRRAHNHRRPAHLRQRLRMILLTRIHIHMRAQIFREFLFTAGAGERDDLVAHFIRVLEGQVAEAAEALDRDGFAARDFHLAHGVEDCDAGAENGGVGGGVDVGGDVDGGFGAEGAVFGDFGVG